MLCPFAGTPVWDALVVFAGGDGDWIDEYGDGGQILRGLDLLDEKDELLRSND